VPRKIIGFFIIPLVIFYIDYIPYYIAKLNRFGEAEFQSPVDLLRGSLMMFPITFFLLVVYLIGFLVYSKFMTKLKVVRFYQYLLTGTTIGTVAYLPFLLIPDSISNWPWSIYYCTLYSSLYWIFLNTKLPTRKK